MYTLTLTHNGQDYVLYHTRSRDAVFKDAIHLAATFRPRAGRMLTIACQDEGPLAVWVADGWKWDDRAKGTVSWNIQ